MKICATCGKEKTNKSYYRDARNSDGLRNNCKQCSVYNPNYQFDILNIKEKTCAACKLIKPLEQFIRDERRTLGYGMQCLSCSQLKTCKRCQKKKNLEDFNKSYRSKDGYGYQCKKCTNEVRRIKYNDKTSSYRESVLVSRKKYVHKKTTREGRRERMLLEKYQLTLEQYQTILKLQNGLCKICKNPQRTKSRTYLSVDHDHKCCPGPISCGKCIRGLLCDSCNQAIGLLLEDPEIIVQALEYIKYAR